ncbi:MAG: monofunctional biosynthetic peptidoglycan transglycosylase [Pseudobdellovibrionaceae bacterium]
MKSLFTTFSLFAKLLLFLALFMSAVVIWALSQFPTSKEIRGCLTTKMFNVDLCPGGPGYVKLSQISDNLEKAVLISEDSAFYQHNGFDLQELENSIKKNLAEKRFARGGSTISQQLAKNMFLNREKTLTRKVKEAIITLQLERELSKKEILERYLNVVQLGKDIFGVKKAASFYFKKHPSELTVLESAFLAFLLPSPEVYSKSFYKKSLTPFARKRLAQIIDRLYSYNRISDEQYLSAKVELEYFLTGTQPPPLEAQEIESLDEEAAALEEELGTTE